MRLAVIVLAIFASCSASIIEHKHFPIVKGAFSGSATTTRYWDCCKPTCSWTGHSEVLPPVSSCAADGVTVVDNNIQSGCASDGSSYVCNNNQPFVINDTLSYGFVAAGFTFGTQHLCCTCVLLTFKGDLYGKKMVAQITNTGSEDADNHFNTFDILIPGGGVGLNPYGCSSQWGSPTGGWGNVYGGVDTEAECSQLPAALQSGCKWRFQWMKGVSNPDVDFVQVECPAEIVSRSSCNRGIA